MRPDGVRSDIDAQRTRGAFHDRTGKPVDALPERLRRREDAVVLIEEVDPYRRDDLEPVLVVVDEREVQVHRAEQTPHGLVVFDQCRRLQRVAARLDEHVLRKGLIPVGVHA